MKSDTRFSGLSTSNIEVFRRRASRFPSQRTGSTRLLSRNVRFQPDARLIDYLYKTRIERLDKILKEIDDQNLKIEAAKEKELKDKVDYKSKNAFRYYEKQPDARKVDFEEI